MLRLIFIISIVISCIRSYGQFTGINHQITKSITYEIANYHLQEFKDLLVYFDIEENDFDFENNLQNDDDLFKFTENSGCGYFTNLLPLFFKPYSFFNYWSLFMKKSINNLYSLKF